MLQDLLYLPMFRHPRQHPVSFNCIQYVVSGGHDDEDDSDTAEVQQPKRACRTFFTR